jgi:hypothetical protein
MRMRIWMRIQFTKMMRIHADPDADPDPQHWTFGYVFGFIKASGSANISSFDHEKPVEN